MKNHKDMEIKMVPSWLRGTWTRTYIRRRREDVQTSKNKDGVADPHDSSTDHLGEPDSTIHVRYIQTPWAFVDVRSKSMSSESRSKEKPMAFAGVTTILVTEEEAIPPLVKWHAFLDMDEDLNGIDCKNQWIQAEADKPRPTNDVGYFRDVSKEVGINHAYHEYDPNRTLLEQWVRIDDGDEKFLAVRNEKGTFLLVIAGHHFGYANQEDNVFISGVVKEGAYEKKENWVIESTAVGDTQNLKELGFELPNEGNSEKLKILKGSTLPLDTIKCLTV